ncbi:MAG: hypothetical protein WA897_07470 [Moheibacter sp.]
MKKLQNQETVFATKDAKHAKRIMEASTDKKVVRHDGHNLVMFHNGTFARIQNINNLFSVDFRKYFKNSKPICGVVLSIIIA